MVVLFCFGRAPVGDKGLVSGFAVVVEVATTVFAGVIASSPELTDKDSLPAVGCTLGLGVELVVYFRVDVDGVVSGREIAGLLVETVVDLIVVPWFAPN